MNVNRIVRTMKNNIEGKEYLNNIKIFNEMDDLISNFFLSFLLFLKQKKINVFDKKFIEKMKKNSVFVAQN